VLVAIKKCWLAFSYAPYALKCDPDIYRAYQQSEQAAYQRVMNAAEAYHSSL